MRLNGRYIFETLRDIFQGHFGFQCNDDSTVFTVNLFYIKIVIEKLKSIKIYYLVDNMNSVKEELIFTINQS